MKAKTAAQKRRRPWKYILMTLILLVVVLWADSRFRLVTTEYISESLRLPVAFDGYRIVQLSDLHGYSYGEDNSRLVKRVAACKPDLIVFTGDFIDSADEIPVTETLAEALIEIAPVYFVSGNHDWGSGAAAELETALERQGVVWLHNEYVTLERNGAEIVLAGVEDPNSWAEMLQPDELVDIIRTERPEDYILFLGHRNSFVKLYPELDVDIILSGHAHGGIVRLPGLGGLLGTEHNLFPEYDKGVFSSGPYDMILSGGLGDSMFPNEMISARFLNNPEIVCVTLHCA